MLASEKRWRRLIFKWTGPRGFITIVLFFALAFFFESIMVYFFTFSGLTDNFTFDFLTVTISPLFHVMPLGVTFVLLSSWIYLTNYVAVVPSTTTPTKKQLRMHGRRRPSSRMRKDRKLGRIVQAIKTPFSRIGTAFLRIRGISYVHRRLSFRRAAVKSTATVLSVFVVSVLLLYILVYPRLLQDLATSLYTNPSFHGFVLKTIEIGQGIAQALYPIRWLASAINEALRAAAPSFRTTVEGLGASGSSLATIDLVWKYTLCQNAAAWTSAIVALAYGEYVSRVYRIRKLR